jgi:aminopeptidase N
VRDYLRLVLSGVESVPNISMVQTLLMQSSVAVRRYADPAWQGTGLRMLADALRGLLERAEPGSDAQLAFARGFVGVALTEADLELVQALLDGSAPIDGLAVDTDLRWTLLGRLVSRGLAGPPEIDAQLAADVTDEGERRAAYCRAAIPTAENKQATWEEIIGGKLPNATFRAVVDGFFAADQDDLVEPYGPKYFDVVGGIWRDWKTDMAQYFAVNAYPLSPITETTIRITDDYLARTDPPPALRRLINENRDGVARALRCQARDRRAAQSQIGHSRAVQ